MTTRTRQPFLMAPIAIVLLAACGSSTPVSVGTAADSSPETAGGGDQGADSVGPAACVAGNKRCDGNTIEECIGGVWSQQETCLHQYSCNGGECVAGCWCHPNDECGDDGCGGSCGTCGPGSTCSAYQCVPAMPDAGPGDVSTDAVQDAGSADVTADAPQDSGLVDAGTDAGQDTGPADVTADHPQDSGLVDAGTDAGQDTGPADIVADIQVDVGPACQEPLMPLVPLVPGVEPLCQAPGLPCGWAETGAACDADTACADQLQCWYGACLQVDASGGEAGCVEARVHLTYGGAAPDRIYDVDIQLPPFAASPAGGALTSAEGMYYINPVPCEFFFDPPECLSYHTPIVLSYDVSGLHIQGGSGFTLFKLRTAAPSVSQGTVTSSATTDYKWQFGLGGNEEAWMFQSALDVETWSPTAGCVETTLDHYTLVPDGKSDDVVAVSTTAMVCP